MKSSNRKIKKEEKFHFDQFIHLAKLEVSQVMQPNPPDPDIFFKHNGLTIGLEIEKIFGDNNLLESGSKLQEAESLRNKVVELAVKEVKNYISWPFEIHVAFMDNDIKPEKVAHLSGCLAKVIIENLINFEPTEELIVFEYKNPDCKINLRSISFFISTLFEKHFYDPIATEFIRNLDPDNIIKAISKKEKKLKDYAKNCDKVWLLIVELGSLSSLFDNVEYALSQSYESNFDKIIYLRSFIGKYYFINTVVSNETLSLGLR